MKIKSVLLIYLLPLLLAVGCHKVEPDPVPNSVSFPLKEAKRTILVYAVASNSLYFNYLDDLEEMIEGAQRISGMGSDIQIAVYSVVPRSVSETASLSVIAKMDGVWTTVEAKSYDRETFSSDPRRITEVIQDVIKLAPAEEYGLVLWSHGTGWQPSFSSHEPVKKAFGQDIFDNQQDWCDINELADAIPEGIFDYVWFDCCYMGSIEVAAEMSRKVPWMVAYPSEVWNEGMPYDIVLPYLASADLTGAAEKVSSYFKTKNKQFSIGVYDFLKADFKRMAALFGEAVGISRSDINLNLNTVQKYNNRRFGNFYDLRELGYRCVYNVNGGAISAFELADMLGDMVVYSDCSDLSFTNEDWSPEHCSGVSAHYPGEGSETQEKFYEETLWGKMVMERVKGY